MYALVRHVVMTLALDGLRFPSSSSSQCSAACDDSPSDMRPDEVRDCMADSPKADWAHIYLSVLPTLPLGSPADEASVIAALKGGAASIFAKHSTRLRKAAVAQLEIRLRVTDNTGAWRLVASSPTGARTKQIEQVLKTVSQAAYVCASPCYSHGLISINDC